MESEQDLREIRRQVTATTREIVRLIAVRNGLAKKIGELKAQNSLPAEDAKVEDALVDEVIRECEKQGVDSQVGLKVLGVLLAESKRVQGIRGGQGSLVTPMNMFAKALQLQASGKELVRLDVGEPDFHPPRAVLDATSKALEGFKTHYTATRGIPQLVSALRQYLETRHSYSAKENEVIVTPGGRFSVYLALATTVKEGEGAIIIEPNWPAYKEALQYIGARAATIRTTLETGWEPSLEEIKGAIRPNTKAIVLSYPSNPTGKIISPSLFKDIVEVANDHQLTVISDEIYTDYAYKPCSSILGEQAGKFILTASFSKTWAMTGFRVGYAVSSDPEVISRMMKIQSLIMTSVPEFIQYGAIEALTSQKEVVENSRAMKERIEAANSELAALSKLEWMPPDGAMYVFPQVKNADFDSGAFSMRLLEHKGVTISPGTGFGDYPRCFRISLGQSKETIVEGIRRIGEELG